MTIDIAATIRALYDQPHELPLRLVGGPAHGRIFHVTDAELVPTLCFAVNPTAPRVVEYHRSKISEDTHEWVYVWSGI